MRLAALDIFPLLKSYLLSYKVESLTQKTIVIKVLKQSCGHQGYLIREMKI